ncbi:Uncharacterised protein [Burkholderia pseudomallei]|nr:Uncharacterised protein [Burkholderia pseudomallei]CAK1293795.1 Uncharacterised protein [Burkholderia pseudomallei]CAK1295461.1 Uncharacterised protein [Burkholderia pseudomallei]CAK1296349.1 Uncharacterised protein [Burkholderia pseudomallei]CAK1303409.1 Uncharacterised protein [Burkholderia pseudomallei]
MKLLRRFKKEAHQQQMLQWMLLPGKFVQQGSKEASTGPSQIPEEFAPKQRENITEVGNELVAYEPCRRAPIRCQPGSGSYLGQIATKQRRLIESQAFRLIEDKSSPFFQLGQAAEATLFEL